MIVRYFSKEEREKLLDYLFSQNFEGSAEKPCFDVHDSYGYIVDLKGKRFFYERPAWMAAIVSAKGRGLSVDEFISYYESLKNENRRRIILHIPHCGEIFPKELMESSVVSVKELIRQHNALMDEFADMIIPQVYDSLVKTEVSRIFCDVERFLVNEPMEKHGMGYCYSHGFDGTKIKNVTPLLREKTLKYYTEHHKKLDDSCSERMFLFDLHSFSAQIIPAENLIEGKALPDVCLGFDDEYTDMRIVERIKEKLEKAGFTVSYNYPYSGSMVPDKVLKNPENSDCLSLMIEINRATFREFPARAKLRNILCEEIIYIMENT